MKTSNEFFNKMPIPNFQDFMLPTLELLADGKERSNPELYSYLENYFNLSEDERNKLLSSGKQRVVENRINWSKSYMKQAGLISLTRRGYCKSTKEGMNVIHNLKPNKIDINYLMRFPSFIAFKSKTSESQAKESCNTQQPCIESTPEELIESGYNSLKENLTRTLLTNIKQVSPRFFEKLVVDLLLAMGYGGSRQEAGALTGRGSDEGIDGVINEDKLGLDVIYVQAKRWEGSVGRKEIQGFAGALQGKRAKKGVFITASGFTQGAHEFVKSIDSKIILIDGERLAELMIEHNVGVSTVQTFALKKVDSDYFSEE